MYKKKGSAVEAKNYRRITILPIITKVLEAELRKKIQPLIEANQNSLQLNSSPMNGFLILKEVIREHKDKLLSLYIAFLDAKSAFDVVCHNSLMRELFHIGVDGVD